MKKLILAAAATMIAAGGLAAMTTSASAEIVCNSANPSECWHTHDRYDYQPSFGVTVHPNDWRWEDRDRDHYRWHEHEGRGYWRNGVWITF